MPTHSLTHFAFVRDDEGREWLNLAISPACDDRRPELAAQVNQECKMYLQRSQLTADDMALVHRLTTDYKVTQQLLHSHTPAAWPTSTFWVALPAQVYKHV